MEVQLGAIGEGFEVVSHSLQQFVPQLSSLQVLSHLRELQVDVMDLRLGVDLLLVVSHQGDLLVNSEQVLLRFLKQLKLFELRVNFLLRSVEFMRYVVPDFFQF